MVDETEFRDTLRQLNLVACPFAKTILNNHYPCRHSHRHLLAGREIAGCRFEAAQTDCRALLAQFRQGASFSLRIRETGSLPHGKAIRIQVGGLNGLHEALGSGAADDIYGLVEQAIDAYERLDALPFEQIMPAIARFKGRRKHPGKSRD